MSARRALAESIDIEIEDASLAPFRQSNARRAVVEDDVLTSVVGASATRRAVATPLSFESEEPLSATRPLPKITKEMVAARTKAGSSSLKLRRSLLSAAAAVTAGAALIVPNALSTVTAQDAITYAAPDTSSRTAQNSRDANRTELVSPITETEAKAIAAEEARVAEEARLAEEARVAEEARLAEEARAAEQAAASASPTANGSSSAAQAASPVQPAVGACAFGDGSNLGLTSQAQVVYQAVCARFPNVTSYGGWRASSDDHGAGRAVDIMISGAAGWEIANWLVANSSTYNIDYVIYSQQINGSWSGGWTYMEDRGSITQNHYDHVHVSVR